MRLFRISFHNQGKVYEIYAKRVYQGDLFGFIEVSGLSFEETSAVLVDPSVERLRLEFKGVERTLIPIHAVIRVDEVEKAGPARVLESSEDSKVTPFPGPTYPPRIDPNPRG
jgi:hypothetical protein